MCILLRKGVLLASFTEEKVKPQDNAGQCLASGSAVWLSPGKITSHEEQGLRPRVTPSDCHWWIQVCSADKHAHGAGGFLAPGTI